MRFAPHLGYISTTEPLFQHSVGTIDPVDHIAFAAQQGFAGIFDPWMIGRPAGEIERLVRALHEHDLECGGLVYAPVSTVFSPLFARAGDDARREIERNLQAVLDLAARTGARVIEIVLQGTPELTWADQKKIAVGHLRAAGDLAAAAGRVIGIEPMIALPDLMLQTTEDAVAFLEDVDHPAVQLMFDTGHVHDMDGDIHAAWTIARDRVCTVQLADMPGRVALGAGSLDLVPFLAQVVRDGKADGLIELEHGWTDASAAIEHSAIARLRRITADVREALETDISE